MAVDHNLLELLPAPQRLALAYAPARARPAWLALLALDARLGQHVRAGREPILAQIRLAWWRDRLREPAAAWPLGEPVLAALSAWHGKHDQLGKLVDGWEMLLGEAPLAPAALEAFVSGRAAAMQALALVLDHPDAATTAHRAGSGWAMADLAAHLSHPDERAAAGALAERHDWRRARLPRVLRPLTVLHGLGARAVLRRDRAAMRGRGDFVAAMRLGILGF
jgi:phytoene synthase